MFSGASTPALPSSPVTLNSFLRRNGGASMYRSTATIRRLSASGPPSLYTITRSAPAVAQARAACEILRDLPSRVDSSARHESGMATESRTRPRRARPNIGAPGAGPARRCRARSRPGRRPARGGKGAVPLPRIRASRIAPRGRAARGAHSGGAARPARGRRQPGLPGSRRALPPPSRPKPPARRHAPRPGGAFRAAFGMRGAGGAPAAGTPGAAPCRLTSVVIQA